MRPIPLATFWLTLLALAGCGPGDRPAADTLCVGYQKWGTMSLVKLRGGLERRLAARGVTVRWAEFSSGPPLLEALNAGSVHVGHAGDCPPLFAQAAGVPLVYVGASTPSPGMNAILVPADSPVRTPANLRGRRVGLTKGTSAHTLLLRVLDAAGLTPADVTPVYLAPSDARAALEGGAIDAWSIWDPYLASAEHAGGVRVLLDGEGYVSGREFYLASRAALAQRRDQVRAVLAELEAAKAWADGRPAEVAALQAPEVGMPLDAVLRAEGRRGCTAPSAAPTC